MNQPDRRKNIWLHGSYFGSNFGDLLLVSEARKLISEQGNSSVALPFCAPSSLRAMNVSRGWGGLISSPERVVFCGGGYFGEPGKSIDEWTRRFNYRHGVALWAAMEKAKRPPIAVGIGFGPISATKIRDKVVRALSACEICHFRDEESLHYFEKYGGRVSDGMAVTTDLAIGLHGTSIESPQKIEQLHRKGVRVGLIHLVDKYEEKSHLLSIISAMIELIKQKGDDWRFFVIMDGKGRGYSKTKQERAADYLLESALSCGLEVGKINFEDCDTTMAYLANADYVLTSKLHVGIVSSAFGRNVCAIPYHPKTPRFYRQMDEAWRCFSSLDWRPQSILEHAKSVLESNCPVKIPQAMLDAADRNKAALFSI
ncbi:polysaccharide pyruvyl transferase family protein [Alcanivorax sp. JB21]|uniref:polysaccharide pyruvyl transferase family protein n=1 Tax=Alcanivorax limicola TaxID=2874102 RepID=UPI001CC151E0|nr:polysaccharide pyruvyl transferase family protein [Alcanivorax limicola]MBZ2188140.1 polysaccharide pyruvyl transferase family protein [Alcanivorax limicola]